MGAGIMFHGMPGVAGAGIDFKAGPPPGLN
jgi:hypothetical protein